MSFTNVDEYLKLKEKIKEIKLPSGAIFEIKKVSTRDKLLKGEFPIINSANIKLQDEKNINEQNKNLSKDSMIENINFANKFIVEAVINPKMSLEQKEGFLYINDLSDEDANFLLEEISNYSFGRGQDLKSFSNE